MPRLPAWQFGNQLLALATSSKLLPADGYDLIHADAAVTRRAIDVLAVHTVTARWLDLPRSVWRVPGARGAHEAFATRVKARLELKDARRARAVVVASTQTADDLVARGVERERITVIPFGVDVEHYRPPTTQERIGARDRFGIGPDDFTVGFVGALGPRKGFPLVVEAMRGTGDVLLAAGEHRGVNWGPSIDGFRAVMPGKLDDVRDVYRAADVLAYPSRYDAFGMVVLEAMASGLPVIVSPETGAREAVGDAGVILGQTDAASLRAAIDELREPDTREPMGRNGVRTAGEKSWDETGATLLNVYRSLSENPA